jgi:hypothetical protein
MYQDDRLNQIQSQIESLTNIKRQLREREKSLRAREQMLTQPSQFQFNNIKSFKQALSANLAPDMWPCNVGGLNEVTWPFFFQCSVDFTDNPTISENTIQRTFFQVDQEAAFILMSVTRDQPLDAAGATATTLGAFQVEFVDRQSSRRFNDAPLPLQMLGDDSLPTVLPTGMLLMPNAFLDVLVSGLPPATAPQTLVGSGVINFSFFGYRVRVENAQNVLSTIFGSAGY